MTKQTILVIRLGKLGDAVMTFPAITALKAAFPQAVVGVLTEEMYSDLFRLHSSVDKIHTLPFLHYGRWRTKQLPSLAQGLCRVFAAGYNTVIDLQDNSLLTAAITFAIAGSCGYGFRTEWYRFLYRNGIYDKDEPLEEIDSMWSSFHRLATKLLPSSIRPVSPTSGSFDGCIRIPDSALRWSKATATSSPLIVMHCGAAESHKIWPVERFAELGQRLASAHPEGEVILLSGPCEDNRELSRLTATTDRIRIIDTISISQMAAIISRVDLFVSTDTGPSHLAGLLAVPRIIMVQPLANQGIWYDGYDNRLARYVRSTSAECSDCPGGKCRHSCMVHITTEVVFSLSQELLALEKK